MSKSLLSDPEPAEVYDSALRWVIPSRSNPHDVHVVELGASPGYSACDCTDFEIHFLPLLKRGVTPEAALQAGLVKRRKYQDAGQELCCYHIIAAERALAKATIRSLVKARELSHDARSSHIHRSHTAA